MKTGSFRYLWKIYLEKERFELAKLYSGADPDRMNVIMRREAEHSFKVFDISLLLYYASPYCAMFSRNE